MAQNIKPAAQKPADPTVPAKSNKKLMIGVIASLVLIIAAGLGWYFTKGADHAPHAEEVKVVPPKVPLFVALEPFTVNLQRESSDQYLQMGITLKFFDVENEAKIKANLPEIRSKVLQLLTTKTATELLSAEGKKQLVKEILSLSNATIGIIDPPAKPAIAHAAVADAAAAAPQVSETTPEAQHTPVAEGEPVPAPKPVVILPVERKGIIDVLFTSFIIQ